MGEIDDQEYRRAALRAALASLGWTANRWATQAGISESALRAFLKGRTGSLNLRIYGQLAAAAGMPIGTLLGEPKVPGAGGTPAAYPDRPTLPVYATSPATEQTHELGEHPVAHIAPTEPLAGVADAYAIYVPDAAMVPVYHPGERVHVNPHRQPELGKDGVFSYESLDGRRRLLIATLVARGPTTWTVRLLRPRHTRRLDRVLWRDAARIVGKDEG